MDVTEKLLLKVEQSVHRDGWDQPSWLGLLVSPRDGVLGLAQLPLRIENPPADFLAFVAGQLAAEPDVARSMVGDRIGLQGIAFVCEGWQAPADMTPQQHRDVLEGRIGYPDLLGAVEVRMITAVMLTGQVLMAQRERGRKPACYTFGAKFGGAVPMALTAILAQLALHVADGEAYHQILQDLHAAMQAELDKQPS